MPNELLVFFLPYCIYLLTATVFYFSSEKTLVKNKKKLLYKSFFSYCFPKSCYWTPSAKIDVLITALNALIFSPLFLIFWGVLLSKLQYNNEALLTANKISFHELEITWKSGLIAFCIFFLVDGINSYQHYLSHRISFLWKFHKVHHAATALNLFTAERHHPFSLFIANFLNQATILGLIFLFEKMFGPTLNTVAIWVLINFIGLLLKPFDVMKHTHIWISLGPLNAILQSPAMHQMHHSVEPQYHHKNFAGYFSIWDRLMGTLYVPKENPPLLCGLKKSEWGGKHYDTFVGSLIDPFKSKG